MFSNGVLLFLYGVTIASSQFVPKLSMLPGGCPPAPELAPMICKLTQNIGVQYRPQIIEPSTFIPPLVIEKCDTPKLEMEINLPLTDEKKPLVIPAPPVLPPITLPKFPVPVMTDKPISHVPVPVPYEPALVHEMSAMSIPAVPALSQLELSHAFNEIDLNGEFPFVIPQAPAIPMFAMPELPVRVPEPAMFVEPCPEDKPIQVAPIPEYVKPLRPIPAAPELPPVRLPELPVRIEIPTPPMIIEKPLEESFINEQTMVVPPLAPIPAAPELSLAPLPELPVHIEITQSILPPIITEQTFEEPCLTGEIVVPQPLAPIPATPVLAPAPLPELPMRVEISPQTFIPPVIPPLIVDRPIEEPCITGEVMVVPELPVRVEVPPKPMLPTMIIERPIEEPCITEGEMDARPEPILILHPPKVPQFIMPEPQMEIMKPMAMPILPSYPQTAVIADPCEPFAQPIVRMGELPPYFVKHSQSHISVNNKKFKEYMVPTMRINGFRPMKNFDIMSLPYVHRV